MKLILLLAVSFPLFATAQTSTIILNGKISAREWDGATEHTLKNYGKVLLQQKGTDLYVAVISQQKIWVHVYLSNGNSVAVLHASAALGKISYTRDESTWRTTDSFKFQMRDTIYNDQLIAALETYYRSNGWVANNGNIGTGKIFEFKINLKEFPQANYFACVVSDYDSNFRWYPATLNDDTFLPALVQGNAPDKLNFNPTEWKKLN